MMTRGDENEGRGLMPDGMVSGHVDDWEELAVDYLDGVLDPSTTAAVDAHLRDCPACAARLHKQGALVAFLEDVDYEAPPSDLEDRVLGQLLFPAAGARAETDAETLPIQPLKQQESRWSALWRRKIVPWVPATIGVVAVLALVVTYGLVRESADESTDLAINTTAAQTVPAGSAGSSGSGGAPGGTQAVSAAEPTVGAPAQETAGDSAASRDTVTTTAAAATTMVLGAGTAYDPESETTPTTASPATTASAMTETTAAVTMAPGTTVVVQNKAAMVADLRAAGAPVYIVFNNGVEGDGEGAGNANDGTARIGAGIATQLTALTGLEPLDRSLWIDGPTFAAYVPREQAQQFVDLLLSIGTSSQTSVSLATQPPHTNAASQGPATVDNDALSRLMEKKAEFVELSASKTPRPAVTDWSFTTSTLPPVGDDGAEAQQPALPDEAGTHVLVVISVQD
ncbi:MAG: zf-HC2 domain-containing protein [Thermoleophilia bacterium]|nr:zf-HC2 domain-containing protein [Thermoleophilia bacterium]